MILPNPSMTKSGANWTYVYTPLAGSTNIDVVFNDGGGIWDNNGGADWHFDIQNCDPVPTGLVITNPATGAHVPYETTTVNISGVADDMSGQLAWTNVATGAFGSTVAVTPWAIPGIALAVGGNEIIVKGSNVVVSGTATNASDDASDAAYSGGWNNGNNGGTGFGAWVLQAENGNSGHFIDAQKGWGMWSHETNHLADASRPFSTGLSSGQTFSVHIQNGWLWQDAPGSIGIELKSGSNQVWQFYFIGGEQHYKQGATPTATDINWTDQGLDIAFTLSSPTTYSVNVTPVGGSTRTYTGAVSGVVDSFRAWSYQNGTTDGNNSNRDFFFKGLKITSPAAGGWTNHSDSIIVIRDAQSEPPEINAALLQIGAGNLQLSINGSAPGVTYAIWSSPMLMPTANWQKVAGSERIGDGATINLTLTNLNLSTNFYRIGFVQ
ncbi:MAG: hypothetical protein M5U15_13850 [Kiritimatiellae bacterium]|nr:hypothetical protein [Kiritimatiellia bacterium]